MNKQKNGMVVALVVGFFYSWQTWGVDVFSSGQDGSQRKSEVVDSSLITPFMFSWIAPVQVPGEDWDVAGLRIGVIYASCYQMMGLDISVGGYAREARGLQVGAVLVADLLQGMQISSVNYAGRAMGVQIGAVNVTKELSGLQIGVVNCATTGQGVQIGLINVIQDAEASFVPIINVSF